MTGTYKDGIYTFVLDPLEVIVVNALYDRGMGERKGGCKNPDCKDCNMARQVAKTLSDADRHARDNHLAEILISRINDGQF